MGLFLNAHGHVHHVAQETEHKNHGPQTQRPMVLGEGLGAPRRDPCLQADKMQQTQTAQHPLHVPSKGVAGVAVHLPGRPDRQHRRNPKRQHRQEQSDFGSCVNPTPLHDHDEQHRAHGQGHQAAKLGRVAVQPRKPQTHQDKTGAVEPNGDAVGPQRVQNIAKNSGNAGHTPKQRGHRPVAGR